MQLVGVGNLAHDPYISCDLSPFTSLASAFPEPFPTLLENLATALCRLFEAFPLFSALVMARLSDGHPVAGCNRILVHGNRDSIRGDMGGPP